MTIQVNLSSLYGPTLSNSSRNQMANDEPYVYLEKLRSFSSKFFVFQLQKKSFCFVLIFFFFEFSNISSLSTKNGKICGHISAIITG